MAVNASKKWCYKMYINDLETILIENDVNSKDIEAAKEYAENLMRLNLPVIFNKEHFSLLLGRDVSEISKMVSALEGYYYNEVLIPKKSGEKRILNVPNYNLKLVQKWILNNILYSIPISKHATGFCKNKSIKNNAELHVNKECVINLDLKDFFPSISQKQVFRIFYYYGYTDEVSFLLSRLCTYKGKLPQGAVTSPYISNIICIKLDKRLFGLAEKYNATYSRYADDITFSGNKKIYAMLPTIEEIIRDEGFILNTSKTRIQRSYNKQEVTGLTVNNGRVSVDKKYLSKFKQEVYYCIKYGPSSHLQHENIDKTNFRDYMYGKAYFIKMIDKELGLKMLDKLGQINWER